MRVLKSSYQLLGESTLQPIEEPIEEAIVMIQVTAGGGREGEEQQHNAWEKKLQGGLWFLA